MMRCFFIAVMLLAGPCIALAEGARTVFDCTIVTTCDGGGVCVPDNAAVTFTLTPLDVGRHGEGTYTITYQGNEVTATNFGWLGPWVWSLDTDDIQTLLLGGPHALVWHHLLIGETPASATDFLTCTDQP